MPIYQFECVDCGHKFDTMQSMSKPNPPCPAPSWEAPNPIPTQTFEIPDQPLMWQKGWLIGLFAQAQVNFAKGKKTPWVMTFEGDVGPDKLHKVMKFSESGNVETVRTLQEWLDASSPCGGETTKLISKGSFQLKGGGWYADGY